MYFNNWVRGFQLGEKVYGGKFSSYIIAEIGTNHGGSLKRAKDLISACAQAGANAVKFQSWSAQKLQNRKEFLPDGQLLESPIMSVLEKYEMPESWHWELAKECQTKKVDFLSSPFDPERARLLRQVGVKAIKIASGDLTYDELLEEVGNYGLPILLSTGMANLGEIEQALKILGRDSSRDIVLLHCVGAYPPDIRDTNLLAMRKIGDVFHLNVGISDHLPGHDVVLAAVALGASVIEKHVTFSRSDGYPDSFYSMEISEFAAMVSGVRRLESALGDGIKQCMTSESQGRINGRRSLFASRDLQVGQVLAREDIAIVRPNIGMLQPSDLKRVLGCRVRSFIPSGTPLCWDHLELL